MSAENGESHTLFTQLCLEHFYDQPNQTIFRALRHLRIDQKRLDVVSLTQFLRDNRQIEKAGGNEYVMGLPDRTPSSANFPTCIETLEDRRVRRAWLRDAAELTVLANDPAVPLPVFSDAAARMIEAHKNPTQAADKLPPIRNAAQLLDDPQIVEPDEIVEGVLHKGCKAIIGSSSKARKTWILLDVALSVSAGKPFWKWRTKHGRVLYVNFEIPEAFIKSRIQRLGKTKGITSADNLDVWTLRGHAAALGTLLPEIVAAIESGKYTLIIIDPIYKGLGGRDENKAGDISELCNELERLAVATGAAVAFAAHYSKGNQAMKEAQDRIGGSGVFARDADTIITLTKHQTEGAYTVDLILRNHPEQPPFVVEWDFPLMRVAEHLDPEDLKKPKGGRIKAHTPEQLLAPIAHTTAENPTSISAWARAAGMNRQTLQGYLSELRTAGLIATAGEGNAARQYITGKGKTLLRKNRENHHD